MSSKQSVAVKKTLSSKKSVATPAPVQVPVEPTPVQEPEVSDETTNDDGSSDKRRVPTRDSIIESFDELIKSIESEMEALREGDTKNN